MGLAPIIWYVIALPLAVLGAIEYIAWRIGEHVRSVIQVWIVDTEDDWDPDDGEPHPGEEDEEEQPQHLRLVA